MLNEKLVSEISLTNSIKDQKQEQLNLNLKELQEENQKLKYELTIFQSKESLHKNTMERVKQIQDDYEKAYQETYNDFKQRESKIKEQYQQYSSKLQFESTQKEARLIEQINSIKGQLESKNELIKKQQTDLMEIIEKNSKNEISFHLKEKDYEALIVSKERKQAELEQAVKSISFEASEKIQSLSNQLDHFQSKLQNTITLEDELEQDDGLGNKKDILFSTNDINHSLQSLEGSPLKKVLSPNDCTNKLNEKEREIYYLKLENERLYAENFEKDKEIAFWKGVKQEFKPINHSTRQNESHSTRSHHVIKNIRKDYSAKQNELQGNYDSNYLTQHKEVNEVKEQYQPDNYSCNEYIPHSVKYREIYPYAMNQSTTKRPLNKCYITQRNQDYYNDGKSNVKIANNYLSESELALKHDNSMKQLHLKIKELRDKLKV